MSDQVEALRKAAAAAKRDGDHEHAKALERAALYHERRERELAAGVTNPINAWMT